MATESNTVNGTADAQAELNDVITFLSDSAPLLLGGGTGDLYHALQSHTQMITAYDDTLATPRL